MAKIQKIVVNPNDTNVIDKKLKKAWWNEDRYIIVQDVDDFFIHGYSPGKPGDNYVGHTGKWLINAFASNEPWFEVLD